MLPNTNFIINSKKLLEFLINFEYVVLILMIY